jgi:multidrug resistance protein, MATE family
VLRKLLQLGIPMGASYLIEVTSFTLMALLIARLGTVNVAGHQLAANLITILYMLPMSIAIATCTLTAQAIGANQYALATRTGNAGLRLAAISAAPIAIAIWLAREVILQAYTSNQIIISAALPLFVFIPLYHFFDAIQVTLAFTLRAYKIAVIPTLICAIALWGVGIGGGYVLGLTSLLPTPDIVQGASGFWAAATVANIVVSAGLWMYLRNRQLKFKNHLTNS